MPATVASAAGSNPISTTANGAVSNRAWPLTNSNAVDRPTSAYSRAPADDMRKDPAWPVENHRHTKPSRQPYPQDTTTIDNSRSSSRSSSNFGSDSDSSSDSGNVPAVTNDSTRFSKFINSIKNALGNSKQQAGVATNYLDAAGHSSNSSTRPLVINSTPIVKRSTCGSEVTDCTRRGRHKAPAATGPNGFRIIPHDDLRT